VQIRIDPKQVHPFYVIGYHINICKKAMKDLLPLPRFGNLLHYTFEDKTRDQFLKLLQDTINRRHWTVPIKTESEKRSVFEFGEKRGSKLPT